MVEQELIGSFWKHDPRIQIDGDTPPQGPPLVPDCETAPASNGGESKGKAPALPSRPPRSLYVEDGYDTLALEGRRRLNRDVLQAVKDFTPHRFNDVAKALFPKGWPKFKESLKQRAMLNGSNGIEYLKRWGIDADDRTAQSSAGIYSPTSVVASYLRKGWSQSLSEMPLLEGKQNEIVGLPSGRTLLTSHRGNEHERTFSTPVSICTFVPPRPAM